MYYITVVLISTSEHVRGKEKYDLLQLSFLHWTEKMTIKPGINM